MKRFVFAFAVLLAACQQRESDLLQGYGEADYIYISSQEAGIVSELFVTEGDQVEAGAPIFRLDPDRLTYQAQSASAQSSALAQAVQAAQSQADLAARNYARSAALSERGFLPRARLDADRAARDAAQADLARARRELQSAGAQSGLAQERLSDANGAAPLAGAIEQIYHRPGEVVAAGAPIVSLLAPQNMKVRFFAPETSLARLRVGETVSVSCDGCAAPVHARISFIASEPQFTPPVIYSVDQREKLVFLVEARLDAPNAIRPGMPVDVRLAAP